MYLIGESLGGQCSEMRDFQSVLFMVTWRLSMIGTTITTFVLQLTSPWSRLEFRVYI